MLLSCGKTSVVLAHATSVTKKAPCEREEELMERVRGKGVVEEGAEESRDLGEVGVDLDRELVVACACMYWRA